MDDKNSTTSLDARHMAEACGLPPQLMYSMRDTSMYSGIPYSTVRNEARSGRMRSCTPDGKSRPRMIKPEWVDEWMGGRDA